MATRRFRFQNYTIAADDSALPEFHAVCVTGEDADCGADSGRHASAAELDRWMAEHARDAGHTRFRRSEWTYAEVQPGDWQ
ncbi:hypothetical protein [Actinacidiphila sp. ITFR-21]|uniref:DUF7848 domain-containing protein n=1 Tax=Actinacidiphila sp. ITFR-21 TaxID=3075199 RepID=UPI00288A0F15|nr:hypothetical protein [Streptomyces sp. ITFR-21]WNI19917.1 hypothetical protein RLT57_30705 [Streptomyces sp. ITFR-21]